MKLRWKITLGFVALAMVCALLLSSTGTRRDVEQTRRSLQQQGFKIDLSEFNLSISPELSQRAAMLGTTTRAALANRAGPRPTFLGDLRGLLTPAGKEAALVVWKLEKLRGYNSPNLWPGLREVFGTNRASLDAARQAAISGPIRFEPIGSQRPWPLLPYLADLKNLANTFGVQMVLALHDADQASAWTNLLASTCLVTEYTPEPIEVSHLVRFACAGIVCDAIWNALQSRDWTDAQLAELQRRWEAVDFWSGLPATAAYSRADTVAMCQLERQQPFSPVITLKEALRSPKFAWSGLREHWRRIQYRHHGTYDDERALLLYYRDRELELRRAVQCPSWSKMRELPGVTNFLPFTSKHHSTTVAMMNSRQMSLHWQAQGQGLLGRAAGAEARRRLIITAFGLERYRLRHGAYPKNLDDLVPELFKALPIDFMDGKPLRYRLAEDNHFVLYSVGLDCVDNGGEMRRPKDRGVPPEVTAGFGFGLGTDLVWPRPASEAESELLRQEEKRVEEEQIDRLEEAQAAAQWSRTARRQAKVESILAALPGRAANEPAYQGRPLSQVLHNESVSGTNRLALADILTLKQVITGAEPEIVAFELPINYDVLTNFVTLQLYIDPCTDEDSDEGCNVGQLECNRATNGNCVLVWNTIYESPGKHALQAGLVVDEPRLNDPIVGPLARFTVSNLCQFSLSSATFDPEHGATLHARLPEPNGTYLIEINSPSGERLKTITGTATNGIIKVHWDLTDDHGRLCTNSSFDTVFNITLPDSGRSQTLKGP